MQLSHNIKYSILDTGEIIDMSRASIEHNITLKRLSNNLEKIVEEPCEVFNEQSYRWKEDSSAFRMPDISIVCDLNSYNGVDLDSVPWFIAEILSQDSTEKIDRTEKMVLYGQVGVKEYWLVHPLLQYIERYRNENNDMVFVDKITNKDKINFLTKPDKFINISNIWHKR